MFRFCCNSFGSGPVHRISIPFTGFIVKIIHILKKQIIKVPNYQLFVYKLQNPFASKCVINILIQKLFRKPKSLNHKDHMDFPPGAKELNEMVLTLCTLHLLSVFCFIKSMLQKLPRQIVQVPIK